MDAPTTWSTLASNAEEAVLGQSAGALRLSAGINKVVTTNRLVRGEVVLLIEQPLLLLTPIESLQILVPLFRIARSLWIAIGAERMSGALFLRSEDVALDRSAQDPALNAHHRVLLLFAVTVLLNRLKSQFVLCHLYTSADRGFPQEPTAQ